MSRTYRRPEPRVTPPPPGDLDIQLEPLPPAPHPTTPAPPPLGPAPGYEYLQSGRLCMVSYATSLVAFALNVVAGWLLLPISGLFAVAAFACALAVLIKYETPRGWWPLVVSIVVPPLGFAVHAAILLVMTASGANSGANSGVKSTPPTSTDKAAYSHPREPAVGTVPTELPATYWITDFTQSGGDYPKCRITVRVAINSTDDQIETLLQQMMTQQLCKAHWHAIAIRQVFDGRETIPAYATLTYVSGVEEDLQVKFMSEFHPNNYHYTP